LGGISGGKHKKVTQLQGVWCQTNVRHVTIKRKTQRLFNPNHLEPTHKLLQAPTVPQPPHPARCQQPTTNQANLQHAAELDLLCTAAPLPPLPPRPPSAHSALVSHKNTTPQRGANKRAAMGQQDRFPAAQSAPQSGFNNRLSGPTSHIPCCSVTLWLQLSNDGISVLAACGLATQVTSPVLAVCMSQRGTAWHSVARGGNAGAEE
jgi:hypothetical protein